MTLDAIVTRIFAGVIAGRLAVWLTGGVASGRIGTVVIDILGFVSEAEASMYSSYPSGANL